MIVELEIGKTINKISKTQIKNLGKMFKYGVNGKTRNVTFHRT